MAYKPATVVKAAKAVTLLGVAYTKDQSLTAAQVKALPDLGALLSKRVLYATTDVHARKQKRKPSPTNIPPRALSKLI